MKNRELILIIFLFLLGIFVLSFLTSLAGAAPASQSADQPVFVEVAYLGEGGTYQVDAGFGFVVKSASGFKFTSQPGPEYNALEGERVWSISDDVEAPSSDYEVTKVIGPVAKGCVIDYATIDDDEDSRINVFKLDGETIHIMPQGMATRSRFVIPEDGVLSYEAVDSIGVFLGVCMTQVTPTATASPSPSPTATSTPAPQSGLTYLPLVAGRPEIPPSPTPSPTPTSTPTEKKVIVMYGDPRCNSYRFDADTEPYSVGGSTEGDFECHLQPGEHVALETNEGTLVILLERYGSDKTRVHEAYWNGQLAPVEYHGDGFSIFIDRRPGCSQLPCLTVEAWWWLPEAQGVFVDLFAANPPK